MGVDASIPIVLEKTDGQAGPDCILVVEHEDGESVAFPGRTPRGPWNSWQKNRRNSRNIF